jgi:CubicO group peptidase (beta-lactamase class C family)
MLGMTTRSPRWNCLFALLVLTWPSEGGAALAAQLDAGVPAFNAWASVPTLVEILNGEFPGATESVSLVAEPGSVHRYSGRGYIVLQLLLTDVAGRPFGPLAFSTAVATPAIGVTRSFPSKFPMGW